MRILIALLFLSYAPLSLAKTSLHDSCSDYEKVAQSDLILLNKKEFIELGQCVGVALLKQERLNNLPETCREVIENELTPLGILSLSKLEAIQIGQCLGVIDYVYERYNNKTLRYDYTDKIFHCTKGLKAVKRISLQTDSYNNSEKVSELLCDYY